MNFFTKFILIILILPGLLFTSGGSRTAWAHASYVRSDPPANTRFNTGQPPRQVQVWFTEELEPKFSELQIFNQKRQRADNADSHVLSAEPKSMVVTLPYNLPDSVYTIEYKVISTQDGHVIKNSLLFVVGTLPLPSSGNEANEAGGAGEDEGENFNLWSVGLRWLNYISMAILLGGAVWWLWVWQPVLNKIMLAAGPGEKQAAQVMEKRSNLVLFVAMVGLGLGWVGWLFYQGTRFGEMTFLELFYSNVLSAVLFNSRFGIIWLLRLFILIITILIFFFMFRRSQVQHSSQYISTQAQAEIQLEAGVDSKMFSPSTLTRVRKPGSDANDSFSTRQTGGENLSAYVSPKKYQKWGYLLLLLCGMQLAFSTLFNSHARANPVWLLLPVHWLHLLAASFWIGGLVYLALVLPPALAALPPAADSRARLKAALLIRFSKVAVLCVAVLVITGAVEALLHLRSISDFFDTAYGLALFIKLLAVSLLFLLGAYNLVKVRPLWFPLARRNRNKAQVESGAKVGNRPPPHWWLSVKIEALLAVGLLAIVGGLTSFGPPVKGELGVTSVPVEQPGSWLAMSGQIADLSYILRLDLGKAGYNEFDLFLTRENKPLADQVEVIVLRLNPDESGKSTSQAIKVEFSMVPDIPGYYLANSQLINMAGTWQAELSVKLKGYDEVRTSLQIKISP